MSREYSKTYTFDCGSDHGITAPCNGHTLRIEVCGSSDTISIEVDRGRKAEQRLTLSDNGYDALDKAMDELRLRWALGAAGRVNEP